MTQVNLQDEYKKQQTEYRLRRYGANPEMTAIQDYKGTQLLIVKKVDGSFSVFFWDVRKLTLRYSNTYYGILNEIIKCMQTKPQAFCIFS